MPMGELKKIALQEPSFYLILLLTTCTLSGGEAGGLLARSATELQDVSSSGLLKFVEALDTHVSGMHSLKACATETPLDLEFDLSFDADSVHLEARPNVSLGPTHWGTLKGKRIPSGS